ncbi:MAG: acyl-CoA thioesterase/bile acid-CoA:amino acid N-acyltransferase family protein [Candidatus Acidiferrales bacterium]
MYPIGGVWCKILTCPKGPLIALTDSLTPNIQLEVSPRSAFIDEEVRISVQGLRVGQPVSIAATTEDDNKRRWKACAEFRADTEGNVKLATQESRGGSYRGKSSMGLFWSMTLAAGHSNGNAAFAKNDTRHNSVSLEVKVGEKVAASAVFERKFLRDGTATRDLTIGDGQNRSTVGRLFIPPSLAPRPSVIVLSGSGGGFDLDKAAVLSRHGFAAFALAYFGIPPLPAWLHRIPLEYFEAAIGWLAAQPEVESNRIGALGVSRGAELALLLGATFPQIHPVVAYAPSHVAWAAGGRDEATGEIIPTWTYRGKPLPFAPLPLRGFMLRSAVPVVALKRPVIFRNLFRAGLRNREAMMRAPIPVERICGPILLVSGGDDGVWPAREMSEAIVARLKQHRFAHDVEHLHYPQAGHMLRYPYLPTTSRESRNPHLRNARFSFGGSAEADGEAQTDSWRRAIAFLQAGLR